MHLCYILNPHETQPMNNVILCRASLLLGMLFTVFSSWSQRIVNSTAGYQVNITIVPIAIVPSSLVCPYGYNYNVSYSYLVSFSGTNIPANLYTLQGSIGCGSNSHFFNLPRSGGAGILSTSSNQWRSLPDCATSTIQSMLCSNVTVRISGLGIPSQNVTVPISLVILPSRVVDFALLQVKDQVRVTWRTDNRTDSAAFTLERSRDGVLYTTLSAFNRNSYRSTVNEFEYFDQPPGSGTYYYRLKQQAVDGKVQLSASKTLRYNQLNQNITVFPVYSRGNTIQFSGQHQWQHYELNVLSLSGIRTYQCRLNSSPVVLPYLAPGRYILNLLNRKTGEITNLNYVQL